MPRRSSPACRPARCAVRVGLDYLPDFTGAKQRGARTRLQFTVIVDDGKMIVASETSDPATDRRVRVEVTATMLK